ncbi:MAG TPA: NAD(P)/FAD-dependent oxidoreductase [Roseiflexaceae bacterium]|nr:NAD(P)/FAD-dependent oxidoreductase [Roseiflexaceae bacterium]
MRDLIIIGGGASGLAAATYARSKKLNVLLIAHHLGGKAGWHQQLLGEATTEYIAGEEAVRMFERELRNDAGHLLHDKVLSITPSEGIFEVATANHGVERGIAVLLATGVRPVMLDVPGAAELMGHGLGYSATTHAPALAGKSVAVIGATERALQGANELAHIASKLYLIANTHVELLGSLGIALQYRPNVEVLIGYHVTEIAGAFNVEELVVDKNGDTRRLAVDAVFVDVGLRPNSDLVRHIARVELNGLVRVDEHNATTCTGLYAAGDVTTTPTEHILIALGEGARAAMAAHRYILAHPQAAAVAAER